MRQPVEDRVLQAAASVEYSEHMHLDPRNTVEQAIGLHDELDPRPKDLKVGDALRRTITIEARDTFAMMLPSIGTAQLDGLATYSDPPVVQDAGGERGETRVGSRTESTSYILQKEGHYELPGVSLVWWDVGAGALRTARVDPVAFDVAPNPDLAEEIPLELSDTPTAVEAAQRFDWRREARRAAPWALVAALVLGLVGPGRSRAHRVSAWWRERQRLRKDSEAAHFARFQAACGAGDPPESYRRLMAWLQRSHGGWTLIAFGAAASDPELTRELRALSDRLFSEGEAAGRWNGEILARLAARARAHLSQPEERPTDADLPDLNPR